MAVNVGLDVSIDNRYDWEWAQEKTGEVNCAKAYINK
jgi:hypothetical protein